MGACLRSVERVHNSVKQVLNSVKCLINRTKLSKTDTKLSKTEIFLKTAICTPSTSMSLGCQNVPTFLIEHCLVRFSGLGLYHGLGPGNTAMCHTPGTPVHYQYVRAVHDPPLRPLQGLRARFAGHVHLSSSSVQCRQVM